MHGARVVLPYVEQPSIELGPITIHAFGVAVALAILVGVGLAERRAPHMEVRPEKLRSFIAWILVPGLVSAHVLDIAWYHTDDLGRDPSLLLEVGGLSSMGGFVGAALGALAWKLRTGARVLRYVDLTLSVLPIAWTLGRLGCTLAHDHPGIATSASNPLAFAHPDGPRWDLGFLEALFSLGLSLVVVALWSKPRPRGTYLAVTCLAYAPVRFALDFLRASASDGGDERHLGLTPAQWMAFALMAIGLAAWQYASEAQGRSTRATRAPVIVP